MGDNVTLMDSLAITVFSTIVVTLVLIGISALIGLLRSIGNKETKEDKPVEVVGDRPTIIEKKKDDGELVAVIAAAVAASLGTSVESINIRKIRRLSQSRSSWSEMSKKEQLLSKL